MNYSDFTYEKKLWKKGFKLVGGCDEVGRGCFAGPVVASTVVLAPNSNFQIPIFNENDEKIIINDSKKLTRLQRERADDWIRKNCITYGVGLGTVSQINKLGIVKATNFAFRSAIRNAQNKLSASINFILIDAFYIPYTRGFIMPNKKHRKTAKLNTSSVNQFAITYGDSKSFSIAAASIIAKVYRDKYMQKLSINKKYSIYGWEKNKGYGTAKHREVIKEYGISKLHRTSFVNTYLSKLQKNY